MVEAELGDVWTTRRRANRVCRSRKVLPQDSGRQRSAGRKEQLSYVREGTWRGPTLPCQYLSSLLQLCLHDLPLAFTSHCSSLHWIHAVSRLDKIRVIRLSPSRSTVYVTPQSRSNDLEIGISYMSLPSGAGTISLLSVIILRIILLIMYVFLWATFNFHG